MAEGNATVVRKIIEAFNRGELDAVLELCDPEIEFDWSRRLLDPVVLHGHEGVRRFMQEIEEIFGDIQIDEEEVIELGDDVVWIGAAHFRGRASGADVRAHAANVWTVRDGKATSFRLYQTREDALESMKAEQAPTAGPPVDLEQA
jgi:ketosteroid isomerase-like protein